ncbi:MAG TPA: hypothetical protein GX705_02915 [Clostridiales bacterium]|nr:hypothetical protein [Clostridiales bacterium]
MISWSNQLYLSKSIDKKELKSIKKKLDKNKFFKSIYCITFASNIENLFDIYNVKQFVFPYYKKKKIHILGLAKSKKEAFELISKMIEDIYKETGEFKVRDYFT